jgi:bis(5'-nucleosidyl)-tetraphosphatase
MAILAGVLPAKARLLSCGAVVARDTSGSHLLLMLRAFRHWDFPKGLLEPGESPEQAALREVREETSLTDLKFPWGYEFFDSGPYNRGKVSRYYLALTCQAGISLVPNPATGRPEHSEYRWLTPTQARRLASPRVRAVIDWADQRLAMPRLDT